MADFNLGRMKFVWQGEWATATQYVKDDVVRNNISSYICLVAHTAGTFSTDLTAARWELMLPGSEDSFPTTTLGDIIYHGVTENERLPIGSQGQALLVNNGIPSWVGLVEAENVFYVSEDGSDANDGRNLNKAFASVKHACASVTGPAVIHVKTGAYTEILPIVVPATVTIQGDGQRVTKIRPVNVTSTGADIIATTGAGTSTTIICNNAATTGTVFKVGAVVTGTTISGTVTITAITANFPLNGFTRLTVSFSSQTVSAHSATVVSNYSGSTMFQLSDASMLNKLYMEGMTGFTPNLSDPENIISATSGGVFVALNPASPIATKSPYVLECSAFSVGGIGAIVDGSVHASGNKSIVFHAYTCINDGGVGFWVNGEGKSEMVSCFTYFCWFGYATTAGGRIRSLSGNNSYGKYGAVSRGFDAGEVTNNGAVYGDQLEYVGSSLVGEFEVGQGISNGTGASGTITNVQTASDKIYYISTGGTFAVGDTITSGGNSATIAVDGVTGQKGFVLVADGFSAEPRPGGSIEFTTGDTGTYVIQSVGGTYTNSSSVLFLVLAGEKVVPSVNNTVIRIRYAYSQSRLTGHDFLSIGTGGIATTNYPGVPTQAASQANEVVETFPGRVFYVSTDQDGNFRVGDYFRVDQATGRATLNASAFDLSGLTSLRLGSIGAQLGELVNEFSSDDTLSGDSNAAVPTEAAVRGYFGKVATSIVPLNDLAVDLGSPTKRWRELYVGAGSIKLGTLTISDVSGRLAVTTEVPGANAISTPTPINPTDAANKAYVDEVAQGIIAKPSVRAATTSNLAANYNNGTNGVGATLTADTNRAFTALDGVTTWAITTPPMGVLVKNQTNPAHNGRYNLTTLGSASVPWVLTKCGLCDEADEIPGAYVFVAEGTLYAGTGWIQIVVDPDTFVVGTDAVIVTQFSGAGTFTAGTGLTLTENAFSVNATQTFTDVTVNGGNTLVGGTGVRASTTGTALVNLFNGTAPAGTLTSGISLYSASGDFNFMDAVGGAYRVGYRNVPASGTQTASYTLTTSDVGKYVQVGTGGSITIPNATFAEGDVVSVFNNTGAGITITCSISTAYIGGTDADRATVTLETRGVATVLFISGTVCVITGNVI